MTERRTYSKAALARARRQAERLERTIRRLPKDDQERIQIVIDAFIVGSPEECEQLKATCMTTPIDMRAITLAALDILERQ